MNNDMTNEEAVKILESMKTDLYDSGTDENDIIFGRDIKALNFAIKALEERPQGEWIEHNDGYFTFYTCNKCNGIGGENDKFCGNCGAEMKKGGAK